MPGKIAMQAVKNLFSSPATVKSNEKIFVSDSYRGMISYNSENCVACGLCSKDCPTGALKIVNEGTKEEKKMKAVLDTGRCIFCCQCADSCAKKCISVTNNYNLNAGSREELKKQL